MRGMKRQGGVVGLLALALAMISGLAVAPSRALGVAVSEPGGLPAETLTATVRDLGSLGGRDIYASDISGAVVVGTASLRSGAERAFVYDLAAASPMMRNLGTLGGDLSEAIAVDGSSSSGRPTRAGGRHAFTYDMAAPVPRCVTWERWGEPRATRRSLRPHRGRPRHRPSGGWHAFAYDVSAPNPTMRDLGALAVDGESYAPPSTETSSSASPPPGDERHAFAYDLANPAAGMRDLGTLGGEDRSAASGRSAQVVGDSEVKDPTPRSSPAPQHAFAYDLTAPSPTMQDLGVLARAEGYSDARAPWRHPGGRRSFLAGSEHVTAYDLDTPQAGLQDLGTLAVNSDVSQGLAVDGDLVAGVGQSPSRPRAVGRGPRRGAPGADRPRPRRVPTVRSRSAAVPSSPRSRERRR